MLHIILLLLPGVARDDRNVIYPSSICVARGSDVTINCSFTYPHGHKVQRVLWCSAGSDNQWCHHEPYVYDSNNTQNNFQYIGDKTSDCSLLISNISETHSGMYKFRFITDISNGRWTGQHGANISVHDLRVSMSRSRDSGSTIAGASVNLTCTLNCSGDLAEVQWFKNGDLIQQSEPVLTFTRITAQDSGNYSCALRNFTTTVSEEFTVYIEEKQDLQKITGSPTVLIIVVSLVSLVFITAAVLLIRKKKAKTQRKPTKEREEAQDSLYSTPQETVYANLPDMQEDEVVYSSVSIKPKEMSAITEQEHDSTIYSAVMNG